MVSTTQMIGEKPLPADIPGPSDAAVGPPEPGAPSLPDAAGPRPALDPTRYGDWEKNGRCIDF
jgi:hypothetical protein